LEIRRPFNRSMFEFCSLKGIINNTANSEKAIFSLEYVGQLHEEGLDFVFKGGPLFRFF